MKQTYIVSYKQYMFFRAIVTRLVQNRPRLSDLKYQHLKFHILRGLKDYIRRINYPDFLPELFFLEV